jgi:hypothetical protein
LGGKGSGRRKGDGGRHVNNGPDFLTENPNPNGITPTTNRSSIAFVQEYMSWGPVDLSDPDAMQQRINDYLDLCVKYDTKPLISGLCIVIGSNRQEIMGWSNGANNRLARELSPASASVLQKSLENLEVFWEFAMQNDGYRNPVSGIFIGKNNFAYKDSSETVVRHETAQQGPTRAQLEAKYAAALPEDTEIVVEDDSDEG